MKDKTVDLAVVYLNKDLFFYCNACGDINVPGKDPMYCGQPDELPTTARELYEKYWSELARLPMYVVKYHELYGIAVGVLFDYSYLDDLRADKGTPTDRELFFLAVHETARKYRNALPYETLLGRDTDPDGHEILFFVPDFMCGTVTDFANFIGDHIYTDFETKYCELCLAAGYTIPEKED